METFNSDFIEIKSESHGCKEEPNVDPLDHKCNTNNLNMETCDCDYLEFKSDPLGSEEETNIDTLASQLAKECPICHEKYDVEEWCPRSLPCSHTVCTKCIKKLISRNSKTCPFCLRGFKARTFQHVGVNTSLLDALTLPRETQQLDVRDENVVPGNGDADETIENVAFIGHESDDEDVHSFGGFINEEDLGLSEVEDFGEESDPDDEYIADDYDSLSSSDNEDMVPSVAHKQSNVRGHSSVSPTRGRRSKGGGTGTPTVDEDLLRRLDAEEGWTTDRSPPPEIPFMAQTGMTVPVPATPLGFFQLFFPFELLMLIVEETNKYAKYIRIEMGRASKYHWTECTADDIAKYLGIVMWLGIVQFPDRRMIWNRNQTYSVPALASVMRRDRFETINKYFHTFDRRAIPKDNTDKLISLRPLIQFVVQRCRTIYVPRQNLAIDEGRMNGKGCLSIKVYNPKKTIKYSVKFYILRESDSGYVLDFNVYRGTHTPLNDTVLELMRPHLHKGHHIFMDNYYNSVALSEKLYENGTHFSGTLRMYRGAPKSIKTIASKRVLQGGEMACRKKDNTFVICWMGARLVCCITNYFAPTMEHNKKRKRIKKTDGYHNEEQDQMKPTVVKQYSYHMHGVNMFDQMINYYSFTRRTNRLTKKITMYLFKIALNNAYNLYKKYYKGRKMSLRLFHEHIADKFVYFDPEEWPLTGAIIESAHPLPPEERFDGPPRPAPSSAAGPSARPSARPSVRPSPGPSPGPPRPSKKPRMRASTPEEVDDPAPPPVTRKYFHDPAERLEDRAHHVPQKYGGINQQRRCRVCYRNGIRKDTNYECSKCLIPLCTHRECFKIYHTHNKYWKTPPPAVKGRKGKNK